MAEKPQCARCARFLCYPGIAAHENPVFDDAPSFCPTRLKLDIVKKSVQEYRKPEVREFARLASLQEFEGYELTPAGFKATIPRMEEIIQLAHKNAFSRLGLAFCLGLAGEARMVTTILEAHGFDVTSVCCKAGAIPKELIGIRQEEKIPGPGRYESMCSPITQAEILNSEDVDLVVMMGLCVGHDTLFIKYCTAPITVLAVKDRVTGHNPLAAVYLAQSYYGRLLLPALR
jgi:uncharacterized metal-binding protein